MMTIAKLVMAEAGEVGRWAIYADGSNTGLTIERGDNPAPGMKREWHVCRNGWLMFTSLEGREGALTALQQILADCDKAAERTARLTGERVS